MIITSQQIEAIKNAYEVADIRLLQMYKDADTTNQARLTLRYQEGRRDALRDIIDELRL